MDKRWTIEVMINEDGVRTHAQAHLVGAMQGPLIGEGEARLNPSDTGVPTIGDELAVARALVDLGHRLLMTASRDIEANTHRPVSLSA